MLAQMKIDYPEFLPDILSETRDEFEHEAKMAMVAKLFEMKRLSSGHAAEILGMRRVDFIMRLHHFNVAALNFPEDELQSDLDNA